MTSFNVDMPAFSWDLGSSTDEEFHWSTLEELREEVLRWEGGDFGDVSADGLALRALSHVR